MLSALGIGLIGRSYLQAAEPKFEVVSIHPANLHYPNQLGPTSFRMQSTVSGLIQFAYALEKYAISGGSPWASSESFDIQAETGAPASPSEIRAMVAIPDAIVITER